MSNAAPDPRRDPSPGASPAGNAAGSAAGSADPLREALGGPQPVSFGTLAPEQTALLADALNAERAAQNEGLEEAAEAALTLVPALARGPVRKILFK
ncbi:hypothetical protein [Streptomyces iconiensis]|uniref:Uncharacterized protein n=1 Tax=Streptomyces iconiensis TaxID=1384038 RepID=A0ABT6ZXW1_9ACTN|nr:hypothetical protein [Streptomyces iconiensis]MDJ1133910.1 hypothetical protein [Streptomyces iconiensis]